MTANPSVERTSKSGASGLGASAGAMDWLCSGGAAPVEAGP